MTRHMQELHFVSGRRNGRSALFQRLRQRSTSDTRLSGLGLVSASREALRDAADAEDRAARDRYLSAPSPVYEADGLETWELICAARWPEPFAPESLDRLDYLAQYGAEAWDDTEPEILQSEIYGEWTPGEEVELEASGTLWVGYSWFDEEIERDGILEFLPPPPPAEPRAFRIFDIDAS
jgi:hypothetical protein